MEIQNRATVLAPAPEVISAYSHGWKNLWKPFWMLLLIGLIYFIITGIVNLPQWTVASIGSIDEFFLTPLQFFFASVWSLFSFAFGLLVAGPLSYGISYAYLKGARRENVDLMDLFAAFRKNYWHAVLAAFLTGLIIGVGFIFLIIPGIFIACKLAFVPYLVIDKNMDAGKALGESWKMTNGYAWQVFFMGLLAIPIVIAGFICLGIGVIISVMWISMALASLYFAVDSRYVPQPQLIVDSTTPPAAGTG